MITAILDDYDHPMGHETAVGAKKFKFPAQSLTKDQSLPNPQSFKVEEHEDVDNR